MKTSGLTDEQNDRLRMMVTRIMTESFEGKITRAATGLGVSAAMLHEFINRRRGAGMKLLQSLAEFSGWSVDELLEGAKHAAPVPDTALGARPDWPELRAATEEKYRGKLDRDTMRAVEHTSFGRVPEHLTPEDIKRWHDLLFDLFSRDPEAKKAALED